MANMLSWLLGQEASVDPWPFRAQDELKPYYPTPSEQVGNWIQDALMAGGAKAYPAGHVAHGVRDILSMSPLGIGMSAADLIHAKNANDPMGAAAAAIGMIPAVGPEARAAGRPVAKLATTAVGDAQQALNQQLEKLFSPYKPQQTAAGNPLPPIASGEPLKTMTETPYEVMLHPHETSVPGTTWIDKANLVQKNGQWYLKEGYQPTEALGKGYAPPVKPIFDYEKDDNGLYHVFDAMTGKTHTVKDKESEAKAWINEQKAAAMGLKPLALTDTIKDSPIGWPAKNTPIAWDEAVPSPAIPARPPWMGEPLPEAEREAARIAGGYETPAWRGLRLHQGQDFGPVFSGDHMFSSNNPQLAEMYAGNLHQHPDQYVKENYIPQGSTIAPFMLNTKDYHVADAQGKMWSSFNHKAIDEALKLGKKGVVIHNVWDEPHSTKNLSSPNTVYITFPEGLSTVKSKFALRFDPMDPSVAKGIGLTAGTGAAAYGMSSGDAQAAHAQQPQMQQTKLQDTIDSIMQTFNYQDNMMRYMRLPLANAAERRRNP